MKNTYISSFWVAIALFLFVGWSSCQKVQKNKDHTVEEVDFNSKEYSSAYICPMHCEGSGDSIVGICPVCKMDLVKNPNSKK
ncbi:MAG: hypothetical protein ACI83I_001152 [Bacteroidia bacterium]|jgi:hypothetical protein